MNKRKWYILSTLIAVMMIACVPAYALDSMISQPNSSSKLADAPYGWTLSYPDPNNPDNNTKVVELNVEGTFVKAELSCSMLDYDMWDRAVVSGYTIYGEEFTVPMEEDGDGNGIYGVIYLNLEANYTAAFSVNISVKNHNFKVDKFQSSESTCVTKGKKVYVCSGCNEVKKQTLELEDHDWNPHTVDKQPTYTTKGKESRKCSFCGKKKADSVRDIPVKTLPRPFVFGASITPDLSRSSGYDDLRVKWEKVKPATGYQIQYRLKGTTTWKKYNSGKWVSGTKVYLKNMKDGARYQVRVRSCIREGDKTACSSWYQVMSNMTLAKVKITSITKNSGNYVTVKWKGIPTDGEDGYEVYRATSKNGTYKKVAEVCQKSKTYPSVKISAAKGKTYYYKVKAFSRWDGEHKLYGPWSGKVKCTR